MVVSSGFFVRNMLMNYLRRDVDNILSQTEIRIMNELREPETLMIAVAKDVRDVIVSGGGISDVLRHFNDLSEELHKKEGGFLFDSLFGLFDIFGNYFLSSSGLVSYNDNSYAGEIWHILALEGGGKVVSSPVHRNIITGKTQITFSCMLSDDEGKRLGVIAMNVPIGNIAEFVSNTRLTEGGYGFLADENFELIAHPEEQFVSMHISDVSPYFYNVLLQFDSGPVVQEMESVNFTGFRSIFNGRHMENGWYLGIVTPKGEYYRDLNTLVWFLSILGLIFMAVMIIVMVQIDSVRVKTDKAYHEQSVKIANNLKFILNGLDAMIYVTNPSTGEILFINDNMKKHFGIKGDCVGKTCYKVLQNNRESRCEFCPCYKLDVEPLSAVVWEEHSTVTNRFYRNVDRYIPWPDGRTVHMQHSIDITELIAAKETAEQSSRYKSAFLATMSHEIRTPMNAILGIAEIQLRNENLSDDTEEAFGKIYESGNLLLHIINDILDLSKIEAGKMELVNAKYDLPSLINDTVLINRLRYESKPLEFKLHIDEELPLELIGDELRIKQVLNNVLSNAFKYTNEGEIILSAGFTQYKDDEIMLVFKISDTGQGMTEEQAARLFDEYTRFNLEANRTTIGTGLGMNITKRLVNMMKGDIFVQSAIGKGSAFTIYLPQKKTGSGVCGPELAEKLSSLNFQSTSILKKAFITHEYMPYGKVLIVDDVESNIYVAKGMMAPYGLQIESADSGFEAIEKIKEGCVYDVIFMDHMMPKMDGIETVRKIRETGYKNYIIALTANAIVGQAGMFLDNGFDGYISKPIDSRELNLLLNEYIRNKKPPEIVEAARREQQKNEKKDKAASLLEIRRIFARDAQKTIGILSELMPRLQGELISEGRNTFSTYDEEDVKAYITAVHGIKTALANIGEKELSAMASKLEIAGKERNFFGISDDTGSFINALNFLVAKLKPSENESDFAVSKEDAAFLKNMSEKIIKACGEFDKKAAKEALSRLKQKKWPAETDKILEETALSLLHSSFEEASVLIKKAADSCSADR